MATVRTIDAEELKVALVAGRLPTATARWCVMSEHVYTQRCKPFVDTYRLPQASIACPMSRGNWYSTLWRIEAQGAKACRKTFGIGIRALRAENHYLLEA